MAEDKPAQPKMIPESDLIAFKEATKKREERLKTELDSLKGQVQSLNSELEVAKAAAGSDEEVEKVKAHLLQKAKELDMRGKDYDKNVATLTDREKKARARELVAEYKERGVTLTIEELLETDDPEKYALSQFATHLAEENTKLKSPEKKEEPKPAQVFETGVVSTRPKSPKDMSPTEFEAHVQSLRQTALAK